MTSTMPPAGPREMCIECEDQEAALKCVQCDEYFCRPCWQMQHRKGKRTLHTTKSLDGADAMPELMPLGTGQQSGIAAAGASDADTSANTNGTESGAGEDLDGDEDDGWSEVGKKSSNRDVYDRIRYIPVRLSEKERGLLAVLNGALQVSEYTDNVDTLRWGKDARILQELDEMFQLQAGLLCCSDFKQGSKILANISEFSDSSAFYQTMFEIGRRYKIMNPEKMRSTYGKLMYMLMDAVGRDTKQSISFDVRIPIKTVGSVLDECGGLAMLNEPDFEVATSVISACESGDAAKLALQRKNDAIEGLKKKYATATFPAPEIERLLRSVADSHVYKEIAAAPVSAMLGYLMKMFPKTSPSEKREDLTLRAGSYGAKFSHDHATHWRFVHQSLTLWHLCTTEMYALWSTADADMLTSDRWSSSYRLQNTGQGLNRVQSCPQVSRMMSSILSRVQHECPGGWVGLSVVHLGDRDVPNALTFIDKYTQIPRILAPIVQTIESLDRLSEDKGIAEYFKSQFGSVENLKYIILRDFFLHAFDGSGDDGGSCIDGRLTSTWNWCSKIEKKSYWRVFLLAGFIGFDGDWRTD